MAPQRLTGIHYRRSRRSCYASHGDYGGTVHYYARPHTAIHQLQELRQLLLQEWYDIDQDVIRNIIQSRPQRLQAIINAKEQIHIISVKFYYHVSSILALRTKSSTSLKPLLYFVL